MISSLDCNLFKILVSQFISSKNDFNDNFFIFQGKSLKLS